MSARPRAFGNAANHNPSKREKHWSHSDVEWRSPTPRQHRYIIHRLEEGVSVEKAEATAVQAMAEGDHPSERRQNGNGRTRQN